MKYHFLTRWPVAGIFLLLVRARQSQRCVPPKHTTVTNMADKADEKNENSLLDVRGRSTATERGATFWNTSIIEMKFSIERSWIKSVESAKNKPNYGMTNMDSLLEAVIGNKLEMCGPLNDSYLKEIGKAIGSKLTRSKATIGGPHNVSV